MKKFMMVLVMVFVFACGICGKEIVNEVKRQNDQKFVKTTFYADELMEYAEHKPMKGSCVEYMLDWQRNVYSVGRVENGVLVFTVYEGKDEIAKVNFDRTHRKADDCYRVMVQCGDQEPVCVTYTGNLLQNVVKTELKNVL